MARILIADPLADAGVERLSSSGHQVDVQTGMTPESLEAIIGNYEGLVVRSETQVTAKLISLGVKLQVIGRAGVGVDNIDLEAATQRGIPVVNAPTGNTVAAAEHTLALMLSLSRNIPEADASIRRGEWRRKDFIGVELRDKVLGIIGLGKVGSEVAHRAKGFYMRVIAYDPFISPDLARNLGVELRTLDSLISESDFISIHTPLTAGSKQLLGYEEFRAMKPGVRIINAARGGLVDENALVEAVDSGQVAGAALDVFVSEPPKASQLMENPRIVMTPHLGASTEEAQVDVAVEVADQILAVLTNMPARFTVNVPYVSADVREALAPFIPVATFLGDVAIQLVEGQLESVSIHVSGDLAHHDTELINGAALVGILGRSSDQRVNLVNAQFFAEQRGLRILDRKTETANETANVVTLSVVASGGEVTLAGSSINNNVHLLKVNDYSLDVQPTGRFMMFTEHMDRPGMIGRVGTIAGEYDINISFMEVGRASTRGQATMVVGFDDPVPTGAIEEFRKIAQVNRVRVIELRL